MSFTIFINDKSPFFLFAPKEHFLLSKQCIEITKRCNFNKNKYLYLVIYFEFITVFR